MTTPHTSGKLTVGIARNLLIACWFGSFAVALAVVFYLYLDNWIETDSFKLALGGLNSLYAPYLGAIALYYWGIRKADVPGEAVSVGLSFGLALAGSVVWNLIILLFLLPLLFQRGTVENALENIAYAGGVLSWLVAGAVGYYFSGTAQRTGAVDKGSLS